MKTLATTLALSSLFLVVPAMAGSGHDHGHSHAPAPVIQSAVEKNNEAAQQTTSSKQVEKKDTITITIPANSEKEYKLQIAKGASFKYAWQTDKGDLFYDFHGEPKGDTTGYFKSFEKDTKASASGSLTTTFEGTHGWYWKNNNVSPVVVTLNVSGEYKRLDQPVNQGTAKKNAKAVIVSLIEKNKIDKSWSSIEANSVEKKANGIDEWLVMFVNDKVSDANKQKLYVFLKMNGEYIAANYTGQ